MTTISHVPLLQVEGLTVDFDVGKPTAHRALDGVSLSIAEGEVVGLVGESGSGKTVLSQSILGLLPRNGRITSGNIHWKGRELRKLSEKELRPIRGKEIAMIFQDPQASLNPVYPVGQANRVGAQATPRHHRSERHSGSPLPVRIRQAPRPGAGRARLNLGEMIRQHPNPGDHQKTRLSVFPVSEK